MAGMYPDNKEITSFGKTVRFPGVGADGKFTNGDFNDHMTPPSFLDADTLNLIIDNLSALVTLLGGTPDNRDARQLAKAFEKHEQEQRAAIDGGLAAHRNSKANPHGVTAAQVGSPTTADFNAHKNSRANPHGVTAAQVGSPTTAALPPTGTAGRTRTA